MLRSNKCRHFTGRTNIRCDAGVDYSTVEIPSGIDSPPMYQTVIPCLPEWIQVSDEVKAKMTCACSLVSFPTQEEVDADEARIELAIQWRFEKMADGICPECDASMRKRQVGRCVYAEPCGHRLYQGKL